MVRPDNLTSLVCVSLIHWKKNVMMPTLSSRQPMMPPIATLLASRQLSFYLSGIWHSFLTRANFLSTVSVHMRKTTTANESKVFSDRLRPMSCHSARWQKAIVPASVVWTKIASRWTYSSFWFINYKFNFIFSGWYMHSQWSCFTTLNAWKQWRFCVSNMINKHIGQCYVKYDFISMP